MLKKEMNRFVYTVFQKHNEGFTIVNSLLRIFLITISMPILIFALAKIRVIPVEESLSVHQFFFILQNEANISEQIYTKENRLYFVLSSGETAVIEKYSNVIRRRVDGRGHEIYLRDVKSLTIEPLTYGVNIKVVTFKGEQYERAIIKSKK